MPHSATRATTSSASGPHGSTGSPSWNRRRSAGAAPSTDSTTRTRCAMAGSSSRSTAATRSAKRGSSSGRSSWMSTSSAVRVAGPRPRGRIPVKLGMTSAGTSRTALATLAAARRAPPASRKAPRWKATRRSPRGVIAAIMRLASPAWRGLSYATTYAARPSAGRRVHRASPLRASKKISNPPDVRSTVPRCPHHVGGPQRTDRVDDVVREVGLRPVGCREPREGVARERV